MSLKSLWVAALIAAPVLIALPPQAAQAQASFNLRIGTPPPPLREAAPLPPRRGYIATPGYWNWNGRRHVWVNGSYVRERRGQRYVAPRWNQDRDAYRLERGHWERG